MCTFGETAQQIGVDGRPAGAELARLVRDDLAVLLS
jgi:hypothetical protein